jgi:hypothetical protein
VNHPRTWTLARAALVAAALGMLLSACGGGAKANGLEASPKVPAATLLGGKAAKKVEKQLENVQTSPTATASAPEQPLAIPARTPGPEGNPVAGPSLRTPPKAGAYHASGFFIGQGIPRQDFEFDVTHTDLAGGKQREVWEIQGTPQQPEFLYRYEESQILLLQVKNADFGGGGGPCTFKPPAVAVKLPLEVGATWTYSTRCEEQKEKPSESVQRVVRTERMRIGDEDVDTFVIESKDPSNPDQGTSLVWFAPSHNLVVRQEIRSGNQFYFEYQLDSASPKKK